MSPLNYPALNGKLADVQLEMVRAFRVAANAQFEEEKLRLAKAAGEVDRDDAYDDFLADQYVIAEEIRDLAEELAIVAAYRVVELNAKRLARWVDKAYSQLTYPSFVKLVRARTNVDVNALPGASAVDELRLLNNAIKHEGKVTPQLAHYPGWTVGDRVHPLGASFERLSPEVPMFIEALARAIMPTKLGGTRPNDDVFPGKKGTA